MSLPELTIHQQQITGLVAKGLTNKEIALQLNLSQFTIRNHIHRMMKQVDAANRSEAVRTVLACGYSLEGAVPRTSLEPGISPSMELPIVYSRAS